MVSVDSKDYSLCCKELGGCAQSCYRGFRGVDTSPAAVGLRAPRSFEKMFRLIDAGEKKLPRGEGGEALHPFVFPISQSSSPAGQFSQQLRLLRLMGKAGLRTDTRGFGGFIRSPKTLKDRREEQGQEGRDHMQRKARNSFQGGEGGATGDGEGKPPAVAAHAACPGCRNPVV